MHVRMIVEMGPDALADRIALGPDDAGQHHHVRGRSR
jgi:hypothetical protein